MLPTDSKEREEYPIYTGFLAYFPDAVAAVARCSLICNKQHNPDPDAQLKWDKTKSTDHFNKAARHMLDAKGTDAFVYDKDGILHDAKLAWRAMANLQEKLERLANDVSED